MKEPIINKSKVIIREPQIYVGNVYCKTKKEQQFYKTFGVVATICGVICALGLEIIICFYLLK